MNAPLMSSAPGKVYIAYTRYISSYKTQYDTERYFEVENNNFILLQCYQHKRAKPRGSKKNFTWEILINGDKYHKNVFKFCV